MADTPAPDSPWEETAGSDPSPHGSEPRTLARGTAGGFRGPLAHLEGHIDRNWWQHLFNETYLETDGDVVENEANTRADVGVLLRYTALTPADPILDLCCGQGRHAIALAQQGFRTITGLDRSQFLLGLARERAQKARVDVLFCKRDARQCPYPDQSFACVAMLGNSFGYFEQAEDDAKLLSEIRRLLHPEGSLVLDLADGDWLCRHFSPSTWEFTDRGQIVCRQRELTGDGERLITREIVIDPERGVRVDQVFAERLYGRDRIRNLLTELGFTAVSVQEVVESHSDRGQDLGMMTRRCFVTARGQH